METLKSNFGSNIRNARKRKNLTQEQLSELLDVSEKHLSSVEVGKKFVSYKTLVQLGEVLDVKPSELVGELPPMYGGSSPPPSPYSGQDSQMVKVFCFAVPEGHPFLEKFFNSIEELST